MYSKQKTPRINHWYVNLTGQLIKVRMLVFEPEGLKQVVIEYLDGTKTPVNRHDWDCLELAEHSRVSPRRPAPLH